MKLTLLSLIFAALAFGQTLTLTGPAKVRAGQQVTYTLGFAIGASAISGVQFDSAVQPWTSALANKTVTCNPSNGRCVLIGESNADALAAGVVATAAWTVPASVPASIALSNVLAASPGAQPVALVAPTALPLSLIGDVTGDRKLDIGDVIAAVAQVVGLQPCGSGDQNEDGVCNIHDIQSVVNEVRAAN